jgi:hypothetical protein
MRTGVEQHADDIVIAAQQYHRPACNVSRYIVPGVRNFRVVPDVNPASAEKACALLAEAFGIGERAPIYAEQSRCLVVDYVSAIRSRHH